MTLLEKEWTKTLNAKLKLCQEKNDELKKVIETLKVEKEEFYEKLEFANHIVWMILKTIGGEVRIQKELIDAGLSGPVYETTDDKTNEYILRIEQ